MLLKSEKVRLHPLEPNDMKDVFRWVNDPKAMVKLMFSKPQAGRGEKKQP